MGQRLFWLVVIKAFSWKGHDYAVGDEIQLPLGAAYKLIQRRQAKKIAGPAELTSEQPTEQTSRRRRQKKAAPAAVEPAPVVETPVAEIEAVDLSLSQTYDEPVPVFDAPASEPEPEQEP
jgi:hypothetical protein